ncbi:MAG: hypothetical protein ACRDKB_08315 [Actinomycetota bacterium]
MHLDSVRELKLELVRDLLEPLTTDARGIGSFDFGATSSRVLGHFFDTLGLGVSSADQGGFKLAVRVQRRGLQSHPVLEDIRQRAHDEIDVRYVGRVFKLQDDRFRGRQRPLQIGNSVGHHEVTAGTLGCFVDMPDGDPAILSNNHVLADENQGSVADPILQPAPFDGGEVERDRVASLSAFVPLKLDEPNFVDCAIASLDGGIHFDPTTLIEDLRLAGTADVIEAGGLEIEKLGRTTGPTRGRITAFEIDNLTVGYDAGSLRFDNQIEVESTGNGPFSLGGDSGSLVFIGESGLGFGLLFAGSDQGGSNGLGVTYLNPLEVVLSELDVRLLT